MYPPNPQKMIVCHLEPDLGRVAAIATGERSLRTGQDECQHAQRRTRARHSARKTSTGFVRTADNVW